MLGKIIRGLAPGADNLAIAAALVALAGVAFWVFVLGRPSGESQPLAPEPPASQAEPSPTSVATAPLSPTETQVPAVSLEDDPPSQPPPPPSPDEPPPAQQPPTPPPADEPPALPPPPSQEPPAPPPPPSEEDLYYEVTRVGVTSDLPLKTSPRGLERPFFWVYFENQNLDWSVCGLTFVVVLIEQFRNGGTHTISTITVQVGDLAPLEGVEARTLSSGEVLSIVDYWVVADWAWC